MEKPVGCDLFKSFAFFFLIYLMILTYDKLCELGFPLSIYGCYGLCLNWTYNKQETQLPLSMTTTFKKFLNYRDHEQRHLSHLKILNTQLSWSWTTTFKNFINPITVVHNNGIAHYFDNYFSFQTNLIIFFFKLIILI